jgi:formylglycine-generating enzyme required for sulfatase activity
MPQRATPQKPPGGKPGTKGAAPKRGKHKKGAPLPPTKRPPPKKRAPRSKAPPKGVDLSVWMKLNDPRLGQVEGTVTRSGERSQCKSGYGVFDMMGNRHEWVSDETRSGNGIFAGGYFLDTAQNGEGCAYKTEAHARSYHDYSTGFRCCKDRAAP